MATAADIQATLKVLCRYYRDRNNQARVLDDVQAAVYLDGLAEFDADQLELAARRWMRQSKWFPALSELRGLLESPIDWPTVALLAWTTVERAISVAGVYNGVTFADASVGECVRQTFGSWEHACSYDRDSPGWTIKRQTFLALFPHVTQKLTSAAPVTLRGISSQSRPALIAHVDGLPAVAPALAGPDRASDVLAEVQRRFQLVQGQKAAMRMERDR